VNSIRIVLQHFRKAKGQDYLVPGETPSEWTFFLPCSILLVVDIPYQVIDQNLVNEE